MLSVVCSSFTWTLSQDVDDFHVGLPDMNTTTATPKTTEFHPSNVNTSGLLVHVSTNTTTQPSNSSNVEPPPHAGDVAMSQILSQIHAAEVSERG